MNLDFTKRWMNLIQWNQKSFWYQQLKSRDMDEESGFGTKGSFLELTLPVG